MQNAFKYTPRYRYAPAAILFMAIIGLAGCGGSYGRLEPSDSVTATFQAEKILPGHAYYFTGPDGWPDAIIAVSPEFTLVSDQWTAFEPSPELLRYLMDFNQSHYGMNTHHFPHGYTVLAPDGRKIGVWYSIWNLTTIEMRSDREVVIYPPLTKDLMQDNDDDHDHAGDIP